MNTDGKKDLSNATRSPITVRLPGFAKTTFCLVSIRVHSWFNCIVILALTMQEILDRHIAKKLANRRTAKDLTLTA